MIHNADKEKFVHMRRTRWFNLETPRARYDALCHVLALVRWHDAQERLRVEAYGINTSDSEEDIYEARGSAIDTDDV